MQTIHTIHEPFRLTEETEALREALNQRIEKFNKEVARQKDDVEKLRNADLCDVGPDLVARGQKLNSKLLEFLPRERELRVALKEYFLLRDRDRLAAYDAAVQFHAETTEWVRQQLLELGYIDGPFPGTERPCMIPDLWMRHPSVFAASAAMHALSGVGPNPHAQPNDARIAKIDEELTSVRRGLVKSADA